MSNLGLSGPTMSLSRSDDKKRIYRLEFESDRSSSHWLTVSRDGLLVDMRERTRMKIGAGHRSMVLGKHIKMFIPDGYHGQHDSHMEWWWTVGRCMPVTMGSGNLIRSRTHLPFKFLDGSEHECAISIHPYDDDDPNGSLLVDHMSVETPIVDVADQLRHTQYAKLEVIFLADLGLSTKNNGAKAVESDRT